MSKEFSENENQNSPSVATESPRPALECCADWKSETEKLNGPLILTQARNPWLTQTPAFQFKPWRFCPWCGTQRTRAGRGNNNDGVKEFFSSLTG